MKLNTYLSFDGTCEEALNFYAKCFNGKIEGKFPYEGSPMAKDVPANYQNKLMHATLSIGDQVLMGADSLPGQYSKPQGISVAVGLNDVGEAERIFKALSDRAVVQMPIQETFWAARFGVLTDRFGIPWNINCEKAE